MPGLRTTRPIRPVRGLDDIRAIESRPYDENVTARTLYDLLLATAETVGDRPALTVLRSPEPDDVGTALTHAGLLARVTQAANLFRALGLDHGTGVAAFLTPTLPDLPPLLLGAQVAGVASTINYLLSATAIADLLNAEAATILVIPAPHLDPDCWDKARGLLSAVPSLRHVLVIGGALIEAREARAAQGDPREHAGGEDRDDPDHPDRCGGADTRHEQGEHQKREKDRHHAGGARAHPPQTAADRHGEHGAEQGEAHPRSRDRGCDRIDVTRDLRRDDAGDDARGEGASGSRRRDEHGGGPHPQQSEHQGGGGDHDRAAGEHDQRDRR